MSSFNSLRNNGMSRVGNRQGDSYNSIFRDCNAVRPMYASSRPSVFRPLPGLNPDDNFKSFDQCMLDDGEFGSWVQAITAVQFAFEKKLAFVLQRSLDDMDYVDSPYYVLYNAMYHYAQNPSCTKYWSDLTNPDNRNRLIPKPDTLVLLPVLTYYKGDREGTISGRSSVDVLSVRDSSFVGIKRTLQASFTSEDYIDVTHPDEGAFLVWWNKQNPTPNGIPANAIQSQAGTCGYSTAIVKTHPRIGSSRDGMDARLTPEQMAWYSSVARPWSRLVNCKSFEEQAELICRHAPAGAVVYAFGEEHPEWLTQEVRVRANSSERIGGQSFAPAVAPGYPSYAQPNYSQVPPNYSQAPVGYAPAQPNYESVPQAPAQHAGMQVKPRAAVPRQPMDATPIPQPLSSEVSGTAYEAGGASLPLDPSYDAPEAAPRTAPKSFGQSNPEPRRHVVPGAIQNQVFNASMEAMESGESDNSYPL